MVTLTDTIEKLTVGAPIDFHNLGVFPLFQEEQITPDYLTLDEAIAAGSARAREISVYRAGRRRRSQ